MADAQSESRIRVGKKPISSLHFSDLPEIEVAIGVAPGGGLANYPANTPRSLLERWLYVNGIPLLGANGLVVASDRSIRQAYANRQYLNGWLRNIERARGRRDDASLDEALQGLDDLDDEGESAGGAGGTAAPRQAANGHGGEDPGVLKAWVEQRLDEHQKTLEDLLKPRIDAEVTARIKALVEQTTRETLEALVPRRVVVERGDSGEVVDLGLQHEKFELLLRLCGARRPDGNRLNIWLTGPTQSGKTTAARNVARALGLPFYAESSLDEDYKVTGYRQPSGEVVRTQFREAMEKGGIFLADEADNWNPSAWTALNAPLANGFGVFPDGIVPRHPDCIIIAAANTWGLGANAEYVGRNRLDAATLARFRPQIEWHYGRKARTRDRTGA